MKKIAQIEVRYIYDEETWVNGFLLPRKLLYSEFILYAFGGGKKTIKCEPIEKKKAKYIDNIASQFKKRHNLNNEKTIY